MGTVAAIARGYRADAGLVPEPTRLNLWIATRGLLHGTLTVEGRSAHAEMNQPHWRDGGGVNAAANPADGSPTRVRKSPPGPSARAMRASSRSCESGSR